MENMPQGEVETMVRDYLKAFEARDLGHCMGYFTDDSTLEFVGVYRGLNEIEEWHKARFAAELRLIRLDRITVDGSKAALEGIATSKRLRAWRVNSVGGSVTAVFDGGKIKEMKFGLRAGG